MFMCQDRLENKAVRRAGQVLVEPEPRRWSADVQTRQTCSISCQFDHDDQYANTHVVVLVCFPFKTAQNLSAG